MPQKKHPTPAELAQLTLTTDSVIRSAYGNAVFSGMETELIWECFTLSTTAEGFDSLITTALCAEDDLKELVRGE